MMQAVLKAAADELEKLAFSMPPPNPYTPQFVMIAQAMRRAALTAAAEVGPKEGTAAVKVIGKSGYEYISTYDQVVANTIERCAQVADLECKNSNWQIAEAAEAIAAAIRALKDKPAVSDAFGSPFPEEQ
jgi:hypothetical protein